MRIFFFVNDECPRCPQAKELYEDCKGRGLDVELFDTLTTDGLARASEYSVGATPSVVIVDKDKRYVYGWYGEIPDVHKVIAAWARA